MSTHKRISGRPALAVACLSAAALVAACSSSTTSSSSSQAANTAGGGSGGSSSKITLAGVTGNTSDPYWVTLMCGGTKEAKKLGIPLTWKAGRTVSTQDQQTNLDAALLLKPSGVIIGAFEPSQFSAETARLMAAGTPVAAVNGPITPATEYMLVQSSTDVTPFADLVSKSLGGTGSLSILGGQPGQPQVVARWKPVVDALAKTAPGIKPLPVQYDDFDPTKAATIVSAQIISHPDLKAIYASTGPEGQGAAAAVAQAHKQGQIKIFSYDAPPALVAALKAGEVQALYAQSPQLEGAGAVDALVSYLKAHPGAKDVSPTSPLIHFVPTMIITKQNVNTAAALQYQPQPTCNA
jgi:ribose transport system substrate-binding protein